MSLVAQARVLYKQRAGTVDRRISRKKTSEQIHLEGLLAEYAAGITLGVDPSLTILANGDGGSGDLILPDGKTVSVKYSGWIGGPFCLRSADINHFKDDYGVLTWAMAAGSDRTLADTIERLSKGIIVVGYTDRSTLQDRAYVHNFGYGDRLCIDPWDLRPIRELRDQCR